MFLEQRGFLKADEVSKLIQLSQQMPFVDGRLSNPDNPTKQNQQADLNDPKAAESSRIVMEAFQRSWEFQAFALPVKIAPPMLSRYEPGMRYGAHSDSAFMVVQGVNGPLPLRSDLSCTVFLSDPASYEGGELLLHLGTRPVVIKGAPGEAFVYPSTTLHEVRPVKSGVRLVSLTFIESRIPDSNLRNILFELTDVLSLEGTKMDWLSRVRMDVALNQLNRMWST